MIKKGLEKQRKKLRMLAVISSFTLDGKTSCTCQKKYKQGDTIITQMIESILKANGNKGKATIKIEIDIDG